MKVVKKIPFHKTTEFRNGLYGTLIAFAISPISIFMGFKLNDYLARPILSIEYISAKPTIQISGKDVIQKYFTVSELYHQFVMQSAGPNSIDLQKFQPETENIAQTELLSSIFTQFDLYLNYITAQINTFKRKESDLNLMRRSELGIDAAFYLEPGIDIIDTTLLRSLLRKEFDEKIRLLGKEADEVKQLKNQVIPIVSNIELKVTILNKGSSDGLLRNTGIITIGDSTYHLERIPEPLSQNILNAVPTFNVNPGSDLLLSNSVGRIGKNTMLDLWYKITSTQSGTSCTDLCKSGRYKIILYDQNNEEIYKTEICTK